MNRRLVLLAFVCLPLACTSSSSGGGGGYGGGGGGGGITGCVAYSQALCSKMFSCMQHGGAILVGNETECVARVKLGCEMSAKLPDLAPDRDQKLQACAATVNAMGCGGMATNAEDACAKIPGLRANGQVCRSNAQCQSTFCKKSGGDCGTCAPTVGNGGACEQDSACGGTLECHLDGKCGQTKLVAAGEACDGDRTECPPGYGCAGGICKKAGGAGDPCDPKFKSADCDAGQLSVFCHEDSKSCAKIVYVDAGGDCSASTALCRNGYCAAGKCVGWVKDGMACDEDAGQICQIPAECTNKICTLPSAGNCN